MEKCKYKFDTLDMAKEIVNFIGAGLGNLIYRFFKGEIIKKGPDIWGPEDLENIKGTKFYILGGAIGTKGYTKVLLPLIAKKKIKERLNNIDLSNQIEILNPCIDSATAGSLGAFDALSSRAIDIQRVVSAAQDKNKIPILALIDIGGTKIHLAIVIIDSLSYLNLKVLEEAEFSTPRLEPREFYSILAEFISPILKKYINNDCFHLLKFIGLGQPGTFPDPQGIISQGAKDLGPNENSFIGSNPSELLARALQQVGLSDFSIYVCNDGIAQFKGAVDSIRIHDPKLWQKLCGNKIIYLGIGTGLGAGYGHIDEAGIFSPYKWQKAYDIVANDREDPLDTSLLLTPKLLESILNKKDGTYEYGNLLSGNFIRKCMNALELDKWEKTKTNKIIELGIGVKTKTDKIQDLYFVPYSSISSAPPESVIHFLETEPIASPLNAIFLNQILDSEIITEKVNLLFELNKKDILHKISETLFTTENEIRNTLAQNIRDRNSQYDKVISEIVKVKKRKKVVHFIGVGKSQLIGRNLSLIYSNLGIHSRLCEITGANEENLTNIGADDLVFFISNSGETFELLQLIRHINKRGCVTVALTGTPTSSLANNCDYVINSHVNVNPSPIPEAPTTSTTSALAAGAAIAIVVSYMFDYDPQQFFLDHPNSEFPESGGEKSTTTFTGYKADCSFDPPTKIEDIYRQFADALGNLLQTQSRDLDGNPCSFHDYLYRLAKRIMISHFNNRSIFITGAGSSLYVAEKIAATMTSIGIDAVAVNSIQLLHGDFAYIREKDLFIIITFSGETRTLIKILQLAYHKNIEVIVFTSKKDSYLCQSVKKIRSNGRGAIEAIPPKIYFFGENVDDKNLLSIPNQQVLSSFINLTIGDTLAVILALISKFTSKDFAEISHPGGAIARKAIAYKKEYLDLINPIFIKHLFITKEEFIPDVGRSEDILNEFFEILKIDHQQCFNSILIPEDKDTCIIPNIAQTVLKNEFDSYSSRSENPDQSNVMIFGAGSIGLAYIGQIFHDIKYKLRFVEQADPILQAINNQQGNYTVTICDNHRFSNKIIRNVNIVKSDDYGKIGAWSLDTDYCFVVIGAKNINKMKPIIQYITRRRFAYRIMKPIYFIFNENLPVDTEPLDRLRYQIRYAFDSDEIKVYFDEYVVIVPAIDEVIVPTTNLYDQNNRIQIQIENDMPPMYINQAQWKGAPPQWGDHIVFTNKFYPLHLRKLWVHNMAHALIGYIGYYLGYEYIDQAIGDEYIEKTVRSAMNQIAGELYRRWPYDEGKNEYIESRIAHYKNSNLHDKVKRVCRDPLRKLEEHDRLIGPINYIYKYADSKDDKNIAKEILVGLVAAMHYYIDTQEETKTDTDADKIIYKNYEEFKDSKLQLIHIESHHIIEAEKTFEEIRKRH